MSDIQKTDSESVQIARNEDRRLLQNFQAKLHQPPAANEVRENGAVKYLPISFLEMQLDEYFFGLWETKDFKWQVCGNEIVGSITLRVFHPTANIWLERIGAAATMIRLQKGSTVTDISSKIFNALEMDFPHLKADCLVNAAKSLGKFFGRDLNRVFEDQYKPLIRQMTERDGAVTTSVMIETEMSRARDTCKYLLESSRLEEAQTKHMGSRIKLSDDITELRAIANTLRDHLEDLEKLDPATKRTAR